MEIKNNILKIFQGKILRDDFVRHTGIMVVGTKIGDFFNFIFRLVLVHLLSVEEYGVFNRLISLSLVFCQFVSPFQPSLARYIAGSAGRRKFGRVRYILKRSGRDLGIFSLLILAIFIIFSGRIAAYLNIENPAYLVIVGILVAASIIMAVPSAFLQGAQLFLPLAFIGALAALIKLIIGAGLIYLGLKVSGGLWGFIACPLVITAGGIWVIIRYFNERKTENSSEVSLPMLPIYKYFIPTALILGSFWLLTNVDVILVGHFYPDRAGVYSVAQMVGLIILFLPLAVPMVVYPKAAAAQARDVSGRKLLKKGLIAVALFCGLGVLICTLAPAAVLKVLTGKEDPRSLKLIIWFALAMSFYSLAMLVIFYHMAVHNVKIVLPLLSLAALETATIYFYHPTLKSVLIVLLFYSIVTFLVSLLILKYPSEAAGSFDEEY